MPLLQRRSKSKIRCQDDNNTTFLRRRECDTQIGVYIINNPTTITGHLYFSCLNTPRRTLCRRLNVVFFTLIFEFTPKRNLLGVSPVIKIKHIVSSVGKKKKEKRRCGCPDVLFFPAILIASPKPDREPTNIGAEQFISVSLPTCQRPVSEPEACWTAAQRQALPLPVSSRCVASFLHLFLPSQQSSKLFKRQGSCR